MTCRIKKYSSSICYREIGSDIASGELVLHKFERISPAYIGVLAMLGKTKVKVFK